MCLICHAAAAAAAAGAASASPSPGAVSAAGGKAQFFVAAFVRPVMFSAYGFNVYYYGFFVALALLIALLFFSQDLKRARIDLDEMICFYVFLAGFAIGSKAHLAASAFGAGEELSWKSFDLRTGHSFIGSQIGAVACMLVYIRWKGVGVLSLLDVLLPCCLLGHCIGKLGCFFSGDGCYGPPADPADVPWAMSFPYGTIPTEVPVHPTPLYESVCSLAVSVAARYWQPLPSKSAGRRTAAILVLYGVERVIVEQYRQHPPIQVFGGLTEYQFLAVLLFLVGLAIEAFARRGGEVKATGPVTKSKAKAKGGSKKDQ